jgi:hypothetical protein
MSLERPTFVSQIPSPLLNDASDKDKYILNSLSVIAQSNTWTVEEMIKQSAKLEELDKKIESVEFQTKKTNGSVLRHTAEITEINKSQPDIAEIVALKNFIQKYILNKTFAIGFFVTTFILWQSGAFLMFVAWIAKSLNLIG